MLDISGKVTKYTFWVANAINDHLAPGDEIMVYASMYEFEEDDYNRFNHGLKYKKLLNLLPFKYKRSFSIVKRLIKAIEVFLNYFYILTIVMFRKPEVVHTQYIPFADFISIEYYIYKVLKCLSPNTKLVLTIHDVLPHDLKPENMDSYSTRYARVASVFDYYMVHTESCKRDVENYLHLPSEKIKIAYHPIFKSAYVEPKETAIVKGSKIKMVMFGLQTPYKGTDVLVDAINMLPEQYKDMYNVTIAGSIEQKYFSELKKRSYNSPIEWYPYFLPEKELDELINDSNIIILPYRSISQSGVLLLSLFFRKLIITSDLPSFVESLEGYEKDWFFESENAASLSKLLQKIADGAIDVKKQQSVINALNDKYSLEDFANRTISVYKL